LQVRTLIQADVDGATVKLSDDVPVARAPAATRHWRPPPLSLTTGETVFEPSITTVLTVVADPAARSELSTALRRAGFGVAEACTSTEALRLVELIPALIILDHPAGMTVAEIPRLRDLAGASSIPVLQLNASADHPATGADLQLTEAAGADLVVASARVLLRAARAERFFREFLEAAPDAMVLTNATGVIVELNAKVEALFGYGRDELLGRTIDALLPERFRTLHQNHYQAYFGAPRSRRMGNGLELYGQHKNGQEFPVDVSLSLLASESGNLVTAAVRDMTQQRRLESELRQRTRELEEADHHKDLFLLTLAHELRSPLAALVHVGPLLRLAGTNQTCLKAAAVVERQTAHMSRLIEDLVDISLVRSGKAVLHRQPTDLKAVVASAVELIRPIMVTRAQFFEQSLPREPVWIDGDETRLTQVVANLLTNAARYTPQAGRIGVALLTEGAVAVLRIHDNGIGLAANMLTRVFDLFTQVKDTSTAAGGGLGIGLHLVRRLVEMHGGTVIAQSDGLGKGSEFIVRIPVLTAITGPHEPGGALTAQGPSGGE